LSTKYFKLTLLGAVLAMGSFIAMGSLPVIAIFAANPPHLVAYGPTGTLSVGANVAITADMEGATGTPVYQFRIGNRIVQPYSTTSHLLMKSLAAGAYTVTVRSLSMAQDRRGDWDAFRSAEVHFMVGSPHLTVQGPPAGVATNGTATVIAQLVDAVAVPYYRFVINGKTVQAYSTKNTYTAKNLKAGTYQVLVESLGLAQYRTHQYNVARKETVTFIVPTTPVPVHPAIHLDQADVATGTADTLRLSGISNRAAIAWSVIGSSAATGLISGTGDTAAFVATTPGTYTVQALVDGVTTTANIVAYGQATGVTVTPASSRVIADGEATDVVTVNVVDTDGTTVGDFNGTVNLSAQAGVTYSQDGTTIPSVNGQVVVTVTQGTATVAVGEVAVPGISIAITPSALTSSNDQSLATTTPTYQTTTITSALQVATSLKIVDAPTYLDANSQGTESSPMAVVVEDQAGYPMLSGTNSITVSVSGPATLVSSTNNLLNLAYTGTTTSATTLNRSASFELADEPNQTGSITVIATSPGLTSATTAIQAVIAGVPSQMAASLSSQSFQEGSAGITLNLQAEDAQGAPANDPMPVSLTVTKQGTTTPASNILVDGTAVTSLTEVTLTSTGSAAVTLTDSGSGANAGVYVVTVKPASGDGYGFPTQTLTLTETANTLAKVAFVSPSQTITVPTTKATAQYTLQLEDPYGNAVNQGGVSVDIYAVGPSVSTASKMQSTVNGSATTSSTPLVVTTNNQGQAVVSLAAEQPGTSWVLYATVPEQPGIPSPLYSAPSQAMQVSAQVAASLTVSLQDATSGADSQSSSAAVAGNTVDATVTLKDQDGVPLTGAQLVQLTIPAGLSGANPSGSARPTDWTPGNSHTVTMTLDLNAEGQATIPLQAWSEGSATLGVSVPSLQTPVSGQASIFVQPGTPTNVRLFQNGALIGSANPLTVIANVPVVLSVESTDLAGNPVPSASDQVVALVGDNGGQFRLTPTGVPMSTVTILVGQTSVPVYYVNSINGNEMPSAVLDAYQLAVVGPSSYAVPNGGTQAITVMLSNANGEVVSGQTVMASVLNNLGTVTPSINSGYNGAATFLYTAPTSGSGTATLAFTVPGTVASGSTLAQVVTIQY